MYGDYTEFPVAQLVKNLPAMQESLVLLLGWEDSLKNRLHTPLFLGFPGGSDSKESTCNMGNLSLIPGLGRYPGEKNGYPLQNSCLENPHGQRNLVGYSPWDRKDLDTTEQLSLSFTYGDCICFTRFKYVISINHPMVCIL